MIMVGILFMILGMNIRIFIKIKKLTLLQQILTIIVILYLIFSFLLNQFNPISWDLFEKSLYLLTSMVTIGLTGISD